VRQVPDVWTTAPALDDGLLKQFGEIFCIVACFLCAL
jgi:hypothetical protein